MTLSKPTRATRPGKSDKPTKYPWPSKLDVEAARKAMNRLRGRAKRVVPKR